MERAPFVSVVIPTYNRRELLRQVLESLEQQTYPASRFQVILCDDGSTDGTKEWVASLRVSYDLEYLWQSNHGRCAARNLGITHSQGELVLFLDDDSLATPVLIEEHVKAYAERDRIFVRGERQIHPAIAAASSFVRAYAAPAELYLRNHLNADDFIPPTHAHTANLSVLRADLVAVGLLDESFDQGKSWDDADLGYRLAKLGRRLLYRSAARVYDLGVPRDAPKYCERMRQTGRDVRRLFRKHPELSAQIAMFRDMTTPQWQTDSPALIVRKIMRHLTATAFGRKILLGGVGLAERWCLGDWVTRGLARPCVSAYVCAGFNAGSHEIA